MQTVNLMLSAMYQASDGRPLPTAKQMMFRANKPVSQDLLYSGDLFVIERGVAGIIYLNSSAQATEVNMVGFEGIFPLAPLLNVVGPQGYTVVPQLGELHVNLINGDDFREWSKDNQEINRIMLQYLYFLLADKNMFISSAHTRGVEERTARTLLMLHDRTFGDTIPVTHDQISQMVSSHRPTITNVLRALEESNAIQTRRGLIEILDRSILIERAADSYGHAEQLYSEHIAPFGTAGKWADRAAWAA